MEHRKMIASSSENTITTIISSSAFPMKTIPPTHLPHHEHVATVTGNPIISTPITSSTLKKIAIQHIKYI